MKKMKISGRVVSALEVEKDTVFWDEEMPGFGVRAYPSGAKHYVVQVRTPGQAPTRVTLGRHGVIGARDARKRAALVISRIRAGLPPVEPVPEPEAEKGPTVGELARRWLEDHVDVHCKPETVKMYRLVVRKHIMPKFGRVPAASVDHQRVADLHHSLRRTPSMANNVLKALSRIWNAAEARGDLPEGSNPCRMVSKYRERSRERFLGEPELVRLGRALAGFGDGTKVSSRAVAAIRLLLLTGCRKNEILTLKWKEVDLEAGELHLGDSKTGARTVALSPEAVKVLSGIERIEGNPHVIPGNIRGKPMRNLNDPWKIVSKAAELEDIRIHDLRHSFASRALALGENLPAIGRLLGHRQVETTARYAHLADESVRASAVRISDGVADLVLPGWRPTGENEATGGRTGENNKMYVTCVGQLESHEAGAV